MRATCTQEEIKVYCKSKWNVCWKCPKSKFTELRASLDERAQTNPDAVWAGQCPPVNKVTLKLNPANICEPFKQRCSDFPLGFFYSFCMNDSWKSGENISMKWSLCPAHKVICFVEFGLIRIRFYVFTKCISGKKYQTMSFLLQKLYDFHNLFWLAFLTPSLASLLALFTPNTRQIKKYVKCMNKRSCQRHFTLHSPENCVSAQVVHSSHIGEWASNQSGNPEALRSLGR